MHAERHTETQSKDKPIFRNTHSHTRPPDVFLSVRGQSDGVLEVRRYSATCWPNPDGPIRSSFELVAAVREHSANTAGPTVVHDP